MVLSDSFHIRTEAIRYAMELAKRLDASLALLLVLPFEYPEIAETELEAVKELGFKAGGIIKKYVERIENLGISVEPAVRIGDPHSELVKFLAESDRFYSIIWGGEPDSVNDRYHWMSNLKDEVKCNILVPFMKKPVEA